MASDPTLSDGESLTCDGTWYRGHMDKEHLRNTAEAIVADGKGILAADESSGTMQKRLSAIGVESTPETNLAYRSILFTTPGLENDIGGVILFDETFRQSIDGATVPRYLERRGILPGIKVDKGAKPLPNHEGEKVTEGLDGLRERLEEYAGLGARFAKWRSVITIGDGIPSRACIIANAHGLASYASLCQEAGIVPIVEPEVLMDGDHSIERCDEVTRTTWEIVYDALRDHDVYLPGTLLKPSMIISGTEAPHRADPDEVARRTVDGLLDCVPASVPGICFLSGGQGPEEATDHLRIMNTFGPFPWKLSFSYGRALQQPALHVWDGDDDNRDAAQKALKERADANRAAALGKGYVAV